MHTKHLLAILALAFCGFSAVSQASPVVYDFTATLDQPIDGSNQVSGSFAVESTNPGLNQLGNVDVSANDYPLTLNFAQHSVAVSNVMDLADSINTYAPGDIVEVSGNVAAGQSGNSFGNQLLYQFEFQDPTGTVPATPGTPLPTLNLTNWTGTFLFSDEVVNGQYATGTVTSLQLDPNQPGPDQTPPPVFVPEPSTLAVFGLLGLGAILFRRRALLGPIPSRV